MPDHDFDTTEVAVPWRHYYRTYPAYEQDGNYLSARWPGDAHLFAERFAAMLD